MAETLSSSFSLSSSKTDWWNSSRGVPCRSRKGRADCSEGRSTPFSVCQHKHRTGTEVGGKPAPLASKRQQGLLKTCWLKNKERKTPTKQTPLWAFSCSLPPHSPGPSRAAPAKGPAAPPPPGHLHGDPPHLELLDGLQRLRAVGQRLLQVLAVGHPQLLQPRVHGGLAGPRRARSRHSFPLPAPRAAPLSGPPAQRGPALFPAPRNPLRRTKVPPLPPWGGSGSPHPPPAPTPGPQHPPYRGARCGCRLSAREGGQAPGPQGTLLQSTPIWECGSKCWGSYGCVRRPSQQSGRDFLADPWQAAMKTRNATKSSLTKKKWPFPAMI